MWEIPACFTFSSMMWKLCQLGSNSPDTNDERSIFFLLVTPVGSYPLIDFDWVGAVFFARVQPPVLAVEFAADRLVGMSWRS